MYMSFVAPEPRSFDSSFTVVGKSFHPDQTNARGEHARLLAIAAARRLRALDRLRGDRLEDAEYWLACAPVAVTKAAGLRPEFPPLP
jgi:hypothetical protein